MLGKGADAFTAHLQALSVIEREVTRQALMLSFNRVFFLVALLFFLSLPLIGLLREAYSKEA
jgi:DHA2 family multidrug resistance protein